jgi:SAM-dependent methyltransferase
MEDSVYDAAYFEHQRAVGEFGGWANAPRFAAHIAADDDVLDFGCGGGFLLKEFNCRRRLGVEINPTARAIAQRNGVEVFPDIASVPAGSVSVIVSNHCLEHVPNPYGALVDLRSKLRDGGLFMCVVPCEKVSMRWRPDNPDHHLYTFTPLNLGNLFTAAGYQVLSSKQDRFRWPPKFRLVGNLLGRAGWDVACKLWFYIDHRNAYQVRLLARK